MRKLLRHTVSGLLHSGIRVFGNPEKGVRILCYHRVNDQQQDYMTVTPDQFRAQMAFLAEHGYQTISLSALLSGNYDNKSLVVTFDDGFEDNYSHAFPIMKQFGITGTIFLIAGLVGEDGYLDVDQIQEMQRSGFEFGSHTMTHPVLKGLERKQKWEEINSSRQALQDLLKQDCEFFCYPKGFYDTETVKMVQEAGYAGACCNDPGTSEGADKYLLRRTEVAHGDTLIDFERKLAGAYDLMHRTLHILRGRP